MSDAIIETDVEFHFTTGQALYVTVREGRDVVEVTPEAITVTVQSEDGSVGTLSVYRDKLNAVQRTRRVVQPDPQTELEAQIDAIPA